MEDGIKVRVQKTSFAVAWKVKAMKRRTELKALYKRFDEVIESRDLWRNKASDKQDEILKLKNEIKISSKELENIALEKKISALFLLVLVVFFDLHEIFKMASRFQHFFFCKKFLRILRSKI